jgi:hypothetical protein
MASESFFSSKRVPSDSLDDKRLSFGDAAGLRDEVQDALHRHAQQVAPGFFRGQGVPGDQVRQPGQGVPGAPVRPADTPPPRRTPLGQPVPGQPATAPDAPAGRPVTERPWRAQPFADPVAPGFFKQREVPPDQRRQGADAQPPAQPPAGTGLRSEQEKQKLENLAKGVELSLDKTSSFWGNETIGGASAYFAGGPAARGMDRLTKGIIARGEGGLAASGGPTQWFARAYQSRFGLGGDNGDVLTPLFKNKGVAEESLRKLIQNEVEPVVRRLQTEVDSKTFATFSDVEKQTAADHIFVNGGNPQERFGIEASENLRSRAQRGMELEAQRNELLAGEPRLAEYNPKQYAKDKNVAERYAPRREKILSDISTEGEALLSKFERAGESAFAANPERLQAARTWEFLKAYEKDPTVKAADFHITLTPEVEAALTDANKLKNLMTHVEPNWKAAFEEYVKAGEEALKTGGELEKLNRYRFWEAYSKNPKVSPLEFSADLGADTAWVLEEQQARIALKRFEGVPLAHTKLAVIDRAIANLSTEVEQIKRDLAQRVAPLEEKMAASRAAIANGPEMRKLDYLSRGAYGEIPPGVTLSDAERAAVNKLHGLRERLGFLDPRAGLAMERDNIIAPQMRQVAIGMERDAGFKEIIKKLARRETVVQEINGVPTPVPVSVESVLNREELNLWNKYTYFKKGGAEGTPSAEWALNANEAGLIERKLVNAGKFESLPSIEARAARTWRAQFNSDGAKVAEGHFSNITKGLATIAVADFISDRLDNKIWGPSHRGVTPYVSAVTPWVGMMVPGGWLKKGGAMVGLNLVGKYVEHALPVEGNAKWNRILRPDGWDAAALGIATTIPLRNESIPARLALMGVSWGGAKAIKYFFEPPSARETRDKAWELFATDKKERSEGSMTAVIDQLKKLDDAPIKKDPVGRTILDYYLADWANRDHSKDLVNGHRGMAMFLAASGEARLDKGSRVTLGEGGAGTGKLEQLWNAVSSSVMGKKDTQFDYIEAGKDLDLGGQSLKLLTSARIELERAKDETKTHMNEDLRGTKVKQSELADLDKVEKRIDCGIERIYAKHDIPTRLKEIQEYTIKLQQQTMAKLRDQIKATLAHPNTDDKRFLAKMYRDLALIDLAFAGNKLGYNGVGKVKDGMSADVMLGEAKLALEKARDLDPDPKKEDWAQLDKIEKEMEKSVSGAIKAQWANDKMNPLNVPSSPTARPPAPNRPSVFGKKN